MAKSLSSSATSRSATSASSSSLRLTAIYAIRAPKGAASAILLLGASSSLKLLKPAELLALD
eukprot:CAMPEP_0169280162 /NCGR_PEP_ID=MMETSP1016-20121227/55444_1 /TAXON_ID=342587 /ORGANISM="Karlodinium micrum, Strain CCMP2283" /LENGTH=61 /DNA_ID=CAMNT_0009368437 /DNA_START=381 /DNA_END=563 /DNA_ORIENTATION=+